jgi:hypothetical protein
MEWIRYYPWYSVILIALDIAQAQPASAIITD